MLEVRVSSLGDREKPLMLFSLSNVIATALNDYLNETMDRYSSICNSRGGDDCTRGGLQSTKHPVTQVRQYLDLICVSEDECNLTLEGRIQCHAMAWLFNMSRANSAAPYDEQFNLTLVQLVHMYLQPDIETSVASSK